MGLWQLDSKLLCNQCGLAKTLYNRCYQDTHNCPVSTAVWKDIDHLFTCANPLATNIFESGVDDLKKILEEKEINPEL